MNEIQAAVHTVMGGWLKGLVEGIAVGVCVVVIAVQRTLHRPRRRW